MAEAPPDQTARSDEDRKQAALAQKWIAELGISEKAREKWLTRARKIVKRYKRDAATADTQRRFALLWSNTETIRPAVYARPPEAVVSRRFKDADPVGRSASEVLERALSYSIDKQSLDSTLRSAVFDYVLLAKGVAWERYVPTYGDEVTPDKVPVVQITTDAGVVYRDDEGNDYPEAEAGEPDAETGEAGYMAQPEPYRPVVFEESLTDYINFEDFGCSVARTWGEVDYVWRRAYMDRDALIARFGENLGKIIPLDWGPVEQGRTDEAARHMKRAAVYEIWCKSSKKVYWISKSWSSRPLDVRDDPLGLDGFFPCPEPLFGTKANDSLNPVPDYVFYQDQAEEIDLLTARIGQLQNALKVKGFYAAEDKINLNNLFNADNNVLIPVPGWQSLKDDGGLRGRIEWMPIEQVVAALKGCIELRAQLIADVYQITGVADILRGSSDPRATATAERIKGHWGPLRIRDKQKDIIRFARDILRIKGEVIAEKFSVETLRAMTGVALPLAAEKAQAQALYDQGAAAYQQAVAQAQQMGQPPPPMPEVPEALEKVLTSPTWEDVKGLLENNALRQFRIDIESDSTIEPDEAEEKQRTVEFVTALSSMIAQWGPAVDAQPALGPLAAEVIKWSSRKFRVGRPMEDAVERAVDAIAKQAAQPRPEAAAAPPIDPTPVQVATIDQQTEQIKQQGEMRRAQIAAQVKMAEIPLKQADQQLKVVAMSRDPIPQVTA